MSLSSPSSSFPSVSFTGTLLSRSTSSSETWSSDESRSGESRSLPNERKRRRVGDWEQTPFASNSEAVASIHSLQGHGRIGRNMNPDGAVESVDEQVRCSESASLETNHTEVPFDNIGESVPPAPSVDFTEPDAILPVAEENGESVMPVRSHDVEIENELRRFSEFLYITERGKLSKNQTRRLLKLSVVSTDKSYDVLINHAERRSKVQKHFGIMCSRGHMVQYGLSAKGASCMAEECDLKLMPSQRFYYRLLSEQLQALCREKDSFEQLINGCHRARKAVSEDVTERMYDYFDGHLFRRLHGDRLRNWDEDQEIFVFLTLSSDGFEEFGARRGTRSAWPIVFVMLNLEAEHRFKACNALICAFVPGTHDSKHFDSFLEMIVADLIRLVDGIEVMCVDEKRRTLRAFVVFITADWPGSRKLLGYSGHMALQLCRFCLKQLSHIPELRANYAIPTGTRALRDGVINAPQNTNDFNWIDEECPDHRTDAAVRRTWKQLDLLEKSTLRGSKTQKKRLTESTGISRRPILGKLNIDAVASVPYDPMHLVYLGWVKLLTRLLFGIHPRTSDSTPYVLSQVLQNDMNLALSKGARGIPSCWGRPPESFENISSFKAEDFKNYGMFYCPILFSGNRVTASVAKLWNLTSAIVHIVCDPTPLRSEHTALRRIVQRAHALFTRIFYVNESNSFSMTPTTHALLHLPEMLEQCGPLVNVSQFLVERLCGEVGSMVGSRVRPETNLFNKTQTLFSLRLVNGGLGFQEEYLESGGSANEQEDNTTIAVSGSFDPREISEESHVLLGHSDIERRSQQLSALLTHIEEATDSSASNRRLVCVERYKRAKTGFIGADTVFESEDNFLTREKTASHSARQKCWVAGVFLEAKNPIEEEHTTTHSMQSQSQLTTYYGVVKDIWRVTFEHRDPEQDHLCQKTLALVNISWQYGLDTDKTTGMVSSRNGRGPTRGSVRDTMTTIENIKFIKRLIGFFDYNGRRYFLDIERRRLATDKGEELGGMI